MKRIQQWKRQRAVLTALVCASARYSTLLTTAAALHRAPASRQLGEQEESCTAPHLTAQQAHLGTQRRKNARVVLSTKIKFGSGLTNQHAILLSILALGVAASVDSIILPKHVHRSHFGPGAEWQEGGPEALWDVDSITAFLGLRGINVAAEPAEGYERVVLQCSLQHQHWEVADAAHMLEQQIRLILAEKPDANSYRLHIVLPGLMFALQTY